MKALYFIAADMNELHLQTATYGRLVMRRAGFEWVMTGGANTHNVLAPVAIVGFADLTNMLLNSDDFRACLCARSLAELKEF